MLVVSPTCPLTLIDLHNTFQFYLAMWQGSTDASGGSLRPLYNGAWLVCGAFLTTRQGERLGWRER